jgi:hypothetical protein
MELEKSIQQIPWNVNAIQHLYSKPMALVPAQVLTLMLMLVENVCFVLQLVTEQVYQIPPRKHAYVAQPMFGIRQSAQQLASALPITL